MVALVRDMVGNHPARPVLVLSNEPDAGGLKRAREMDVESAVVDHRPFRGDRAAFERAMTGRLEAVRPDIICLAGFMRIPYPRIHKALVRPHPEHPPVAPSEVPWP